MIQNFVATLLTFLIALVWLRLNDFIAQRGWISSDLSRKVIHIGTGPLFVLCWLLYPDHALARYFAALVPLAITAQFLLVGLGIIQDEAAVKAMARSGNRREILRGPLLYGIIFVLLTVVYWQETPIGIAALMILCGGDGLADVLGRRFGNRKLPWNRSKSWVGSLGMFAGGWLLALLILTVYIAAGRFSGPPSALALPLAGVVLVSAAIETLPLKDIDNLTITVAALFMGYFVF